MSNDKLTYESMVELSPHALIITDDHLRVYYMNAFAREHVFGGINADNQLMAMRNLPLFNTDRQVFDMTGCMRSMISDGKRRFQKTLILKQEKGEKLLYLSARHFLDGDQPHYLFSIADISAEMDCVAYAPGGFGKQDFELGQFIIGKDEKIRSVFNMISMAADSDVNVMVTGESGTGKELVADAIHNLSDRKDYPLVKVNCASLSDSLLESELFGHVKGAFTGAIKDKMGKIEAAEGGTLFLDEIGEISPSIQVKLLRVIQDKTIERVGDNKPVRVNMRIIAATNKNLGQQIKQGAFREDLFYRLHVFSIHMPPLRDRVLDIPLLASHFVSHFQRETGKQARGVSRDAMQQLMHHPWPGNIRELRNAIEHAFVLVRGHTITSGDLPGSVTSPLKGDVGNIAATGPVGYVKTRGGRLPIGRDELKAILEAHDWNQSRAAKTLGISRVALWKKIKKSGL